MGSMEREYVRHESERTVENIVKALDKGQSIKWAGGMLEFCCSSELLRKNHKMREKEVLRIIEKYGKGRKEEFKIEMRRRGLIS